MKNLMERSVDLANVLGLIFSALAIFYLGQNIDDQIVIVFGLFALFIFVALFTLNMILLIRDFIRYGGKIIPTDF